jgi:hypothetical protein
MKKILPDRVLAAKIPRTLILSSTQVILEIYCFVLALDCISFPAVTRLKD